MSHREKSSHRKKAMYSEEFQEMVDRLEEEDYVDRSGIMGMKKSRLCLDKVKALEKHFEEDNKLSPERKMRIAEEVGLETRQVAIWFQNRRARSKTKHLEKEYDVLKATYDALQLDYRSLEQEKVSLLNQLEELKAKIEGRSVGRSTSFTPSILASMHSVDVSNEDNSMTVPFSSASCSSTRYDPMSMSSSSMSNGFQMCQAYEEELMRMEEMGMLNSSDTSCNFFSSVDQAPTLHWPYSATNDFNS